MLIQGIQPEIAHLAHSERAIPSASPVFCYI